MRLAAEHGIPFQQKALGRAAPNDSNAIQLTRGGLAAGILALANWYMHSAVETICLDDLKCGADLQAQFAASVKKAALQSKGREQWTVSRCRNLLAFPACYAQ